ncbi:MAG: hypothetical protein PVJ67_05320 [Candidatus Pacearchaeota archaeon]|jgi:hypothetical protein
MNNRRGQIGETMTWVVATIAIIFILSVSIFIVKINFGKEKTFNPYISNDLVITESAVSFFSYENNFNDLKNSIQNEDYTSIKPKVENFLEGISEDRQWNFRVFIDNEISKKSVIVYSFPDDKSKYAYFTFNLGNKKIELKFDEGKNE